MEKYNKPLKPRPPVNVKDIREPKHYSVYDEIARRRRKAQQEKKLALDTDNCESGEIIYSHSLQDKAQPVFYRADNTSEEVYLNSLKYTEDAENERYNPEEIHNYYRKHYYRKLCVILIGTLVFLCLLTAGVYLYISGNVENLEKLFGN